MRLIDADVLKEKLLKMQKDTVNKSDAWKAAYLLVFDEYIKMLDEMPSVTCGFDADDIFGAYGRGYSKGREDILKEQQQMKDYCINDRDALNKAWKVIKMTREEIWDKVIQDLKTLEAGLIVTMAEKLRTDVIHGTIKREDKADMWTLVDDLGYYSIKGQTIKYLPEYQELTALMEKVF